MRFELDDDQQAIQRTAKEFLASRYPAEEVRRLALEDERGFTDDGLAGDRRARLAGARGGEDDGGLGLGVVELAVLQEQLGYALAPTPLLSTIAAALVDLGGGRRRPAGAVAAGARGGRAARDGRAAAARRRPRGRRGDGALTARLEAVPDAADADLLDRAHRPRRPRGRRHRRRRRDGRAGRRPRPDAPPVDGDAGRRAVHAAAARPTARPSRARRTSSRSPSRPSRSAWPSARWRWRSSTPATASSSGARSASSRRSRTPCAQMLLEVEGARSAVMFAAWALDDSPEEAPLAAAMAKAYASDAGWRVPASRRSRCSAGSGSPGSTTCTSGSSAAGRTPPRGATRARTARAWPTCSTCDHVAGPARHRCESRRLFVVVHEMVSDMPSAAVVRHMPFPTLRSR